MSDLEAQELVDKLKLWAFNKWGTDMVNPHGPVVGREITSMPMDDMEAEETSIYTETDDARDYLLNPHMYKPRWYVELCDLLATEATEGGSEDEN